ncbi:sulfatase domain protein [Metarhizium acridum CQMa 102]|uniref:Sulfatase domain protein n=1 Tax=Metarhizium acridum (strain CQMa 102) TaxID=655827 RepID=E9DRE3_METAQ|nr:sulfatase domain protein [Metarhizium acridum CQMa 102]EFY93821.1 sulfatase domain protein [Metarhizium acridum CQMa 102]
MIDLPRRTAGSLASCLNSRRCVLTNRRLCLAFASRFANRRLVFSIAAVSILGAKWVHIYAHITALPTAEMARWGLSFFAQDTALLLMLRLLLDAELPLFAAVGCLRFLATSLACVITFVQHVLASINISFFVVAGSELHWRNIGLAGDSSSWSVLLTGLVSCSIAFVAILIVGWLLQDFCFAFAGMALDIVKLPLTFLFSKIPYCSRRSTTTVKYDYVPQKEIDIEDGSDGDDEFTSVGKRKNLGPATLPENKIMWLLYTVIGILLVTQAVLAIVRPVESSLIFMSWTPILLPFIDFAHSSPTLAGLLPYYSQSIGWGWDNETALAEPIRWNWLPESETPLPGFEDWYEAEMDHYNAAHDPLKISNLEDDLLAPLRGKLGDVDIRHVVLIKLESTRKDVFPIKKDGQIWQKFAETWENGTLPDEVQERLSTLTQNANFLTGDYNDGFEHETAKRRGGLNVNNDHTTGTYTLKSLPGTLCGITPLVADFNVEYANHIYQPCLPHIFNAFNALDHSNDSAKHTAEYTKYKWSNSFMMSVTNFYDKQDLLMPKMGYKEEELIHKEYLQSDEAKFGKNTMPEINYYGMAESAVEEYIRDAFKTANEKNERLFLSHLTSTAHHPFKMPDEETYVPLAPEGKLEDLSHYVNTIGLVDRWLGKILQIIEEEGSTNNTLVVMVGDHGLSVPETGAVTPYYQPNVGNFHVPLVMSHPKLPPIDINTPVNSISILPTILDLLIETGSLSQSERQAASDLVRNYEGQSLIRPLQTSSKHTGQADWQFTIMNTGRAQVATRSAREPNWRLVVPVIKDIEWRFTNLEKDPHEKDGVLSFDFVTFLHSVEKKYGSDAAKWAEEASFMTRWWVDENARRWRYTP